MEESVALRWRKSSYSGNGGGNCVEVASGRRSVLVRDSKDPAGPPLAVGGNAWSSFVQGIKDGEFVL
jgi:Domain of unknown function (DUF397)